MNCVGRRGARDAAAARMKGLAEGIEVNAMKVRGKRACVRFGLISVSLARGESTVFRLCLRRCVQVGFRDNPRRESPDKETGNRLIPVNSCVAARTAILSAVTARSG